MIDVPRLGRLVIEFQDGERNGLPDGFFLRSSRLSLGGTGKSHGEEKNKNEKSLATLQNKASCDLGNLDDTTMILRCDWWPSKQAPRTRGDGYNAAR